MNDYLAMIATCFPMLEGNALPLREIEHRISQRFPNVLVDWSLGDGLVQQGLDKLLQSRAPDVIVESHRAQFGNVIYMSLSFPEWPHQSAFAYVYDKRFQLDFILEVSGAFDIGFLIYAAQEISRTLDYVFVLRTPFDSRLEVLSKPSRMGDPVAEARNSLHNDSPSTIEVAPLGEWSVELHRAVISWLAIHPTLHPTESRIKLAPSSPDAFAASVVKQLTSISPVDQAWKATISDKRWRIHFLLNQGRWTTIISLNSVPIEVQSQSS